MTIPDARVCLDTDDVDFDGRSDVVEGCSELRDTDGDGVPDMRDTDSDNDTLWDSDEDFDGDGEVDPGETDPLLVDTDGDHFDDAFERGVLGTDPTDPASAPGPYLLLPFGGEARSIQLTFSTEIAPGAVVVYPHATNDVWLFVQSFDPTTQPVDVPGTPVVVTVTGLNQSLMPSPGLSTYFAISVWLTTTGGIDLDVETLWIVVPAP